MSSGLVIPACASLVALALGMFLRVRAVRKQTIAFVLLFAINALLLTLYSAATYFTGEGVNDAVLFHMRYGLVGAGFSEYRALVLSSCGVLVVSGIVCSCLLRRGAQHSHVTPGRAVAPFALLIASISVIGCALIPHGAGNSTNRQHDGDGEFWKYYHRPAITSRSGKSRNIVFIYLESLERTYLDENLFPGLTPGLRELETRGTSFTNITQVFSTGWTIGGMVASQCAVPLVSPSSGNSMAGMDRFLPSAVGMGDLLAAEGYHLVYYGGARLDFAGKGKFLRTHGFRETYGFDELAQKQELSEILSDGEHTTGWGVCDSVVLDAAYRRFSSLSKEPGRFGLFLLTLDSHHPTGHPSPECREIVYGDGENPILNAVACTDYLVSDFVRRIQESPYAGQTVIVIASDHLAMRNTASDLLRKGNRRNLLLVLGPEVEEAATVERLGSTLDIAPTVLPYLGFSADIGLGRDLRSVEDQSDEVAHIQNSLEGWAEPLGEFWDFPRIERSIEIDIPTEKVRIDDREFRIPILIEFDKAMATTLRFEFYREEQNKSLVEWLQDIPDDKGFVLIQRVDVPQQERAREDGDVFDMAVGLGGKPNKIMRVPGRIRLTVDNLKGLSGMVPSFSVKRVAHAGGALNGQTYTNSIEALDTNLESGFEYFELDFMFTRDKHLACIHDWGDSLTKLCGGRMDRVPTLAEFCALAEENASFEPCTLAKLVQWMDRHPSASIVTDIKEDNVAGLRLIADTVPSYGKRIIPQIYAPENYSTVKKMGYGQVIWTLYQYRGSNDDVLRWVGTFEQPFAVTMPLGRAVSGLPGKLAERHIPTYVHTINDVNDLYRLLGEYAVADIYTDVLAPESPERPGGDAPSSSP